MMTFQWLTALCLLSLVGVRGWETPLFCHGQNCPEFSVVHTYEDFEERFYNASHWITVDIASTESGEVQKALWTLYYYSKGENEENANVDLPWPTAVFVEGKGDEKHASVSWPVPTGTHLPKPNDPTIRETDLPACTIYVRSFNGMASEANGYDNVYKLKASLKASGKSFKPDKFVTAAYNSPLNLLNQHREVWVFAE